MEQKCVAMTTASESDFPPFDQHLSGNRSPVTAMFVADVFENFTPERESGPPRNFGRNRTAGIAIATV